SLRRRDEMFDDDWVGLLIDTFGDASNAYEIFVNPLGVQGDLMMSTGGNEDPGFDMIYRAEGRITDEGYQVEMAIPYSSLRFPNRPEQQWRVTFIRNHPRETRRIFSWASVDSDNACLMCQFGTIEGMQGIKPGTRLQVMPGLVAYQSRTLVDDEDFSAGYDNSRIRPEPSLNLRYDLTSSLAAEATLNPDFSQIESDAAQIDVNSTFALFYPERRPFFQEGSDLLATQLNLVYTRSINNPIAAAKMTGRTGRTNVAFLSAVDEDTPILLPFDERSELVEGGRSVSNVLRARHTFGTNSYVGGTLTDRRLIDGGYGSVAGVDFQLHFLKSYSIQAEAAISATEEPTSGYEPEEDDPTIITGTDYTAALDGERFAGYGYSLELDRSARNWNFEVIYRATNPTFRTANGFATRNAFHLLNTFQMYRFHPKSGFADVIAPFLVAERELDFEGQPRRTAIRPALNLELKGQTYTHASYRMMTERFRGETFEGLNAWIFELNSNFTEAINTGGYLYVGRGIARNEDVPQKGRFLEAGGSVTVKPTSRLNLRPSLNYARMLHMDSDEAFFNGWILRTQVNYQFTREFSMRLIGQYNQFDEAFSVEPLLAYLVNPFTVLYVGSTHGYGQFGEPYGFRESGRQFFFKVQYLFQR
ncbi:MAG TPA: DUF5916 domain-containing protein, partial [Rhodothermales bacterium]